MSRRTYYRPQGALTLLGPEKTNTALGRIIRGILAGAVGTAAMTAHQEIRQHVAGSGSGPEQAEGSSQDPEDRWRSAPAPAQVGKRLIEAVFGRPVSPAAIPVLTQVMHWSYGSAWGGVYAIARGSSHAPTRGLGPLLGVSVWLSSYAQLVPMGVYQPPWHYPLSSIADEIGYHITYGSAVAAAYGAFDRISSRRS